MKKLLFVVFLLLLFVFATKISFAQTSSDFLFAAENQTKNLIFDNTKSQRIVLMPFTTVTFEAGTFSEKNIFVISMPGRWDNIKSTLLPKDQSPIVSYLFLFKNTSGIPVRPTKPIKIETLNNFTNTTTFYYPLNASLNIDKQNQKNMRGPILAKVDLPENDYGFIIGVNKILDKNDPVFSVNTRSTSTPPPAAKGLSQNLLKKLAVVAVVIIVVTVVAYTYYLKKKSKRVRKVEGPKKIIVGK